jgi:hypothetical protein
MWGGFNGFTISHNVASESEVDQIIGQAVSVGATLVKPPQKVSWGGYSSYFKDPDGYLWEVAYNPYFGLVLKMKSHNRKTDAALVLPDGRVYP